MSDAQAKGKSFPCPSCSAEMVFDPATEEMKCSFCGHLEVVAKPERATIEAHSFDEFLAAGACLQPMTAQALEVTCESCGSTVTFEPPEVAGVCPFCASPIVAAAKSADPLIAPDGLLPAKVPRESAQKEVRQWLATRWFAPNALNRLAQQEGIAGLYLPFWHFAADTASQYTGMRGQHYWETESYQESDGRGNTVTRTRQVQRTAWYPASGAVSRHFDDVLVPATKSVPEPRLKALEPWDLEALCPYEPAYLAGFKAQRYQMELPAGLEDAKGMMGETIQQDVRHDIGGDEQRIDHIETAYSNVKFLHLFLPVWIGAYRFQGKAYQVVINSRTGEVQGERPYSAIKVALMVIFILLVVAILVIIGNSK